MRLATGPWTLRLLPLALLLAVTPATAQQDEEPPPPINQSDDPLLRGFVWRSIGPAGQGGRVDDIAASYSDPSTWYVGFATGGLWKTTNNGTTFEPIFDSYGTHSIGDIAIAPSNSNILYVGTGEPNNRQSSSFGDGMYKSTDAGATFTHIGLRETQSIGRVVVHPTNPDIVWVAAVGHLFGPNADRGVYKTTDGGATWRKVLYFDENTGATDIIIHPTNPNTLFAAMYERQRSAYGFVSGGPNGGIYRSDDGGETWTRVTGNGLPPGTMGRIGLDISMSNPNIIYAQIEVGPDREPVTDTPPQPGQGGGFGGGGGGQNQPPDDKISGVWRSEDGGRTWQFKSNQNQRPMYYSQIRVDPSNPDIVWVGGVNAQKSVDGGVTWTNVQGNMGHVDNHAIWIDPYNGNHVIYGNDGGIDVTYDGGETWESIRLWAVGQPYHVSADMRRPYYVCVGFQDNGSWCGPSSVRGGNSLNQDWYRVGGGDGFYTAVDPTDWSIVYAESQNGNVSRLDLKNGTSQSIRPRGPGGGFGGGGAGNPGNIVPTPPPGTAFRWNWSTPFMLSPHNPSTVIIGGNRLYISRNRGDTWTMTEDLTKQIDRDQRSMLGMRLDLPNCSRLRMGQCILSRNDGINQYGTIISVSESPIIPGILWVGTDDGNIQVSRDNGATWTEVSRNLPGGGFEYYVSRVEASYFDPATAYVSIDGHRSNDLRPYVFVTRDYGATWTSISSNLPQYGNVNTVRQDPKNPKLLYAGTEFGFFVSLDEGASWKPFMSGLAVVRIDDVMIHPRDNDLILATHGRSLLIMDDITALQQLTDSVMAMDAKLFEPREAVLWKSDIRMRRNVTGSKNFEGENAPRGTTISYWLGDDVDDDDVELTIEDVLTGETFRTLEATSEQGLNRVHWDLCSDRRPIQPGQGGFGGFGGGGCGGFGGFGGGQQQGPPRVATLAQPGIYRVTLSIDGREQSHLVRVLEDVWMNPE